MPDNSHMQTEADGQKSLPFKLSGSQAKTAFAIRANSEKMIREDGLNSTGFLTLTVGDYLTRGEAEAESDREAKKLAKMQARKKPVKESRLLAQMERARQAQLRVSQCEDDGKRHFVQIWDAAEASRRINNLNRHLLPTIFSRSIVVTERHANGAVHFHIVGTMLGKPDIRTGFDFGAFEKARKARSRGVVDSDSELKYKLSAQSDLHARWFELRTTLPKYGFGRAELTPIKSSGAAVACYVSKYIEKNICNRIKADKGKKLVRYLGWKGTHLKPNDFEWNGPKAKAWRAKARQIFAISDVAIPDVPKAAPASFTNLDPEMRGKIRPKYLCGHQAKRFIGPRWALHVTGIWKDHFGDDVLPWLEFTPARYCKTLKELDRLEKSHLRKICLGIQVLKVDAMPRVASRTLSDVGARVLMTQESEWFNQDEWRAYFESFPERKRSSEISKINRN